MGGLRNKDSTEIVRESGFETESDSDTSEDETDSESDVSESDEDNADESTTDLIIYLMSAYYMHCINHLMLERSELLGQLQRYTMPNLESKVQKRFVAKPFDFPKIQDECCQTEIAVFLEPCIHQNKHVEHLHRDKKDDDLQTTIKKLKDEAKRSNDLQLRIKDLCAKLQTTEQERDNLQRRCTDLESKTHEASLKNATGNLQHVPDGTNRFDEQTKLVTQLLEENGKQSETITHMHKELERAKTRLKDEEKRLNNHQIQIKDLNANLQTTKQERDNLKRRCTDLESKTHEASLKNVTGNLEQVPDGTNKCDEHELVTQLLEENEKKSKTIDHMQKELERANTRLKDEEKRLNNQQIQMKDLNANLQTTMEERDNLQKRCTDLESKTHEALLKNATGNLQQVPDGTNKFDEQHTLVTQLLEKSEKQSETINRMQIELESAKTRESQVVELQRKCKQTQNELDVVKSRLSKLMGQKLTDNNPNITDLSDRNRPTKLAERFSELYDNQWTDAFDIFDRGNEQETIELLHGMLMDIFQFCKLHSEKQILEMKTAIVQGDHEELPIEVVKQLKDCRKVAAVVTGKQLFESYRQTVLSTEKYSKVALKVEDYLKECFAICWMMCVQDPPVVFSQEMRPGDPFNTDIYKAYTATGNSVAFTVWPGLMLHENGPLLCKGVAQGFNK